jgi:NAD(P)-dependent dehydrogenase (short-subunit alcohol dehydrogenase family)
MSGTAYVVGVGPGLGAAVARRFAREGYAVAVMARSKASYEPVVDAIGKSVRCVGAEMDATRPESVKGVFAAARTAVGDADVLVYNAGAFKAGGVLDVTAEEFEQCWRANCAGGFHTAREVLPAMLAKGRGTILFTGATASLRGSARFSCLAVGKFGLRALAQSIAREHGPRGVHVAHVVIDGQIDTPRAREMLGGRDPETMLAPDALAELYLQLHLQPKTAWTLELDVRPSVERF